MSYMIYNEHYACSVRDAIVFPLGENNWNTLRVDAYIFENGGKKIPVSKNIRYVWSCGRGLRLAKHDSARASRVLVHCKTTTSNCLISLYAKDYNFPSFLYLTWTSFIEILLQEGSPTFITKFLGITTLNFQRMQSHFISDVLTTIRLV